MPLTSTVMASRDELDEPAHEGDTREVPGGNGGKSHKHLAQGRGRGGNAKARGKARGERARVGREEGAEMDKKGGVVDPNVESAKAQDSFDIEVEEQHVDTTFKGSE